MTITSGAVFNVPAKSQWCSVFVITLESILRHGVIQANFERILRKYRDQKWAKTVTEKNFKKFRRPND